MRTGGRRHPAQRADAPRGRPGPPAPGPARTAGHRTGRCGWPVVEAGAASQVARLLVGQRHGQLGRHLAGELGVDGVEPVDGLGGPFLGSAVRPRCHHSRQSRSSPRRSSVAAVLGNAGVEVRPGQAEQRLGRGRHRAGDQGRGECGDHGGGLAVRHAEHDADAGVDGRRPWGTAGDASPAPPRRGHRRPPRRRARTPCSPPDTPRRGPPLPREGRRPAARPSRRPTRTGRWVGGGRLEQEAVQRLVVGNSGSSSGPASDGSRCSVAAGGEEQNGQHAADGVEVGRDRRTGLRHLGAWYSRVP